MSDADKNNGTADQNNNESGNRPFIRETIKKKPLNKRSILFPIVMVCVSAILFGVIAAFVYVNMLKVVRGASGQGEETPRVTIPPDSTSSSETSVTAVSSELVQEGSSSTSASSASSEEQTSGQPQSSQSTQEPMPAEKEFTLEDYAAIHSQLTKIAQDAYSSVVTVTGITS